MLTRVEARNNKGSLLGLDLQDVTDGFVVADIEGLDPVKATLVSSSFAGLDGEQFQSARREARNIILKLELEPDYIYTTVRDLRKRLYSFFMPKSPVNLRFYMADGLVVNIDGRVESCQAPMMTDEPGMDVSIICHLPDLIEMDTETFSGNTVTDSTNLTVDYPGTVETGFVLAMPINRSISEFTIYHQSPSGELYTLDFSAPLVADDVLEISTVSGNKYARKITAGVSTSILYGISPQSKWLEFEEGDNFFRIYATGAAIPYSISYVNKYGAL